MSDYAIREPRFEGEQRYSPYTGEDFFQVCTSKWSAPTKDQLATAKKIKPQVHKKLSKIAKTLTISDVLVGSISMGPGGNYTSFTMSFEDIEEYRQVSSAIVQEFKSLAKTLNVKYPSIGFSVRKNIHDGNLGHMIEFQYSPRITYS